MKTKLPEYLSNVAACCKFLTELHLNKETDTKNPKVKKLMLDIDNLPDFEPDFNPKDFLNALKHENVRKLMKTLCFGHCQTGGGCTAYIKVIEEKHTYITKQNDTSSPDKLTDPISVGVYLDGEPEGELKHYDNIYEYLQEG